MEKFKYVLTALFMFTGFVAVDLFLRYYTNDIGFFDFHQIAPLLFTCFLVNCIDGYFFVFASLAGENVIYFFFLSSTLIWLWSVYLLSVV